MPQFVFYFFLKHLKHITLLSVLLQDIRMISCKELITARLAEVTPGLITK